MTEITQEEAAQAAGHSVKAATTYVVLAQDFGEATPDEGRGTVSTKPVWRPVGEFTAKSAAAARQAYAQKSGSTTTLTLRAVPKRHWGEAETLVPKPRTDWETA